jgi:hypothetical protein
LFVPGRVVAIDRVSSLNGVGATVVRKNVEERG